MRGTGWLFAILLSALWAAPATAQTELVTGCVYNRVIYPEGHEVCQGGTRKRCESGAWGDVGVCDPLEMPEPAPDGDDRPEKPE